MVGRVALIAQRHAARLSVMRSAHPEATAPVPPINRPAPSEQDRFADFELPPLTLLAKAINGPLVTALAK